MNQKVYTENEWHLKQGEDLFNEAWELLSQEIISDEDVFLMIHAAHGSRYHWTKAGTVQDIVRSEWLVSRVYAHLAMGEQALLHGQYSLDLAEDNDIKGLHFANACEAVTRAALLLEDEDLFEGYYRMAADAAKGIENPKEMSHFLDNLKSLKRA